MSQGKFSRRHLLAALGAGGLSMALPMMPSLIRNASAAPGKAPKRFIAIAHYVGHHVPHFFPTANADIKVNDHTFYKKLTDIAGPMSAVFDQKFDPYRSKMNIYHGLDSTGGGGHNVTVPLCASTPISEQDPSPKYGRSIDTLMSNSVNVYDSLARFKALRIGNDYYGASSMSFDRDASGKATLLPAIAGDTNVFNTLFDPANANPNPAAVAAAARHKLLVDRSYDRYKALQANARLSATDRTRFEAHVASMTDLQKRLANAANCTKPTLDPYTPAKPREVLWRNQIDAVVSAMACDMTRVASMYIYDYKFGTAPQDYSESHAISHDREGNPLSQQASLEFSRFKADQILYLLKRLSETTDIDGSSMLDNTVVLWASELSNGNFHTNSDLPVATFGGAGGALKTGYLMDFRLKPIQYIANRADFLTPLGQAYNRLLVTLMRAMGMQESEYMKEGDGGGFGEFAQSVPYIDKQYTQHIAERNTPLPIVFG
jgi:hypothetical protein